MPAGLLALAIMTQRPEHRPVEILAVAGRVEIGAVARCAGDGDGETTLAKRRRKGAPSFARPPFVNKHRCRVYHRIGARRHELWAHDAGRADDLGAKRDAKQFREVLTDQLAEEVDPELSGRIGEVLEKLEEPAEVVHI